MRFKNLILESPVSPHFTAKYSLRKQIKKFAEFVKGGDLIDIGCGEKPYEKYFNVAKYIGIEIIGGSHDEAKKNQNMYYDGVNLPFENQSIDWILCTEVLEHVAEPSAFLGECNRVLKNSGGIILSTPQTWGLHEEPFDFYRYTKYGLKYLLEKNGFSVISSVQTTGVWGTVGQRLVAHIFYKYGLNKYFKLFIAIAICMPLQMFCIVMDMLNNHEGDTLDNVVFAKKINNFV